jgi:POT family proton-dependent oligopeptide transporter
MLEAKTSRGPIALFFIQTFSTMGFAILYSCLELYMEQHLKMPVTTATAILGGFLAFNFVLHLLGGYFGGRYLSYRTLFIFGMLLQFVGCFLLAQTTIDSLLWGMGLFLTGSGLNVTCINMMITQLFSPDDKRREGAFLWNYSGMNLGFWIGYAIAGYYQQLDNYHSLFIWSGITNLVTILIALCNWSTLKDRNTPLSQLSGTRYYTRSLFGIVIMLVMIPIIRWLLLHASFSNALVLCIGLIISLLILALAFRQPQGNSRNRMFAYLILAMGSLIFWTLYQLAPMGLTLYAEYNVNLHFMGYSVTPAWVMNINPTVIIIGGPLMTWLWSSLRRKGVNISIPQQFTASLFFTGIGFLLLPVGIHYANAEGIANFNWILFSYILQSIGELLISPIGYAMVGQLAPASLSGLMMGAWLMYSGVASILSSYCSNWALANTSSNSPLITNSGYSHLFNYLGVLAIICGIILWILIPFLRRLINEKDKQTV